MMAPYQVLLLWSKLYWHVVILPEKRIDSPRPNGYCRQNSRDIACPHHLHCVRTLTHEKVKKSEHRLFMFEPILSPIPSFDQQLNIFRAYQVYHWWGSDLTKCLIVAGNIDAKHIMSRCTYNTNLLFSAPYSQVSQRTKNPPNGYFTNSVMFLLIITSYILTISEWMEIFYTIRWGI